MCVELTPEIIEHSEILNKKEYTMAAWGKILATFTIFPLHRLKNPFFLTMYMKSARKNLYLNSLLDVSTKRIIYNE